MGRRLGPKSRKERSRRTISNQKQKFEEVYESEENEVVKTDKFPLMEGHNKNVDRREDTVVAQCQGRYHKENKTLGCLKKRR